jgi:hypothetical protein
LLLFFCIFRLPSCETLISSGCDQGTRSSKIATWITIYHDTASWTVVDQSPATLILRARAKPFEVLPSLLRGYRDISTQYARARGGISGSGQ